MPRRLTRLATACGFAVALYAAAPGAALASDIIRGRTLDGVPVMLSDYFEPGKWTLVMLWTTYCRICAKQYPVISAFNANHHDKDVKVIGIALDGFRNVARVRHYVATHRPGFFTLVGEVGDIKSSFEQTTGEHLKGTPTYLLFNTQGEVAGQTVGPLKPAAIESFIHDNPR